MFYLITQDDIRKDNPSIDAIPEFAKCNDRELKYVVLTYDYDSPYKKLKFADKQKRAAIAAGYKKELNRDILDRNARITTTGSNPKVQAAIRAFKDIQRDINKDILNAYDNQIEQFIQKTAEPKETDSDWKLALAITKALPALLKSRKEILEILEMREDDERDESINQVVELSTLDKHNQEIIDKRGK